MGLKSSLLLWILRWNSAQGKLKNITLSVNDTKMTLVSKLYHDEAFLLDYFT